ncbi:hypothetical protein N0V90_008463 [Kalmusia sp. IMI 367209]|nr:hypothetical protein N0V90_008463 [Kalmusia sp. IMI 367209]
MSMSSKLTIYSEKGLVPGFALSVPNVIAAVRCGLVEDPHAVESQSILAIRLLGNHVAIAIKAAVDEQPDWDEDVLQPIVDGYTLTKTETDFVVITSVVLLLAYDLIRRRCADITEADTEFILNALGRSMRDYKVRKAVTDVIEAEKDRLLGLDADMSILNALFVLDGLLAQASAYSRLRHDSAIDSDPNPAISQGLAVIPAKINVSPISMALTERDDAPTPTQNTFAGNLSTPTPTPTQTDYFRDVHVQYYLKPVCALELDDIKTHNFQGEMMTLETMSGLRVRIEEGVTVSEIEDAYPRVSIRAPVADGYDLSATVVVPPGHSYILDDVSSINQEDEIPEWTSVETSKATVWIGNGPYVVERHGAKMKVNNVYH